MKNRSTGLVLEKNQSILPLRTADHTFVWALVLAKKAATHELVECVSPTTKAIPLRTTMDPGSILILGEEKETMDVLRMTSEAMLLDFLVGGGILNPVVSFLVDTLIAAVIGTT